MLPAQDDHSAVLPTAQRRLYLVSLALLAAHVHSSCIGGARSIGFDADVRRRLPWASRLASATSAPAQ
jgi:hypothetical protein